jgi:hypothetical protein
MKIEYICHACLLVDTGDLKIATDPWFHGPAYCKQWYVFPKPVNTNALKQPDVILLSHGHEDHLHEDSLRMLPNSAKVFYPYTWYGGTTNYLRSMGFEDVTEARPFHTYQLTPDTSVSYVVNSLDSIIVIESKGEVFVNINDALHSAPPSIVDRFIRELKRRWPRVDTVFSGFGGASYFPNTIHCPGKNDIEIGEAREQLFARNFCRIVHELNPTTGVPFAADFALLRSEQRWINEVRFSRSQLPKYFEELYGSQLDLPRIQVMYSGDVLAGKELIAESPYRSLLSDGSINELVEEQYRKEIAEIGSEGDIDETEARIVQQEMLGNLKLRAKLFDVATLDRIRFTVKVSDICEGSYFNVEMLNGEPSVQRSSARDHNSILELETSSGILRHSFASDWGGDAMTIGYGCDIRVFDQETIKSNLDTVCVRLLTRHPSRRWRVEPLRWLRHIWASPVDSKEYISNAMNDVMRETLFRPKCEVCRACDHLFDAHEELVNVA